MMKGSKVRRFASLLVLLALLITGCGPQIVSGVVVGTLPRTEPNETTGAPAKYWLVISVDDEQRTLEVDPETWVKNYWEGTQVTLDCSHTPCTAVEQDHE